MVDDRWQSVVWLFTTSFSTFLRNYRYLKRIKSLTAIFQLYTYIVDMLFLYVRVVDYGEKLYANHCYSSKTVSNEEEFQKLSFNSLCAQLEKERGQVFLFPRGREANAWLLCKQNPVVAEVIGKLICYANDFSGLIPWFKNNFPIRNESAPMESILSRKHSYKLI